MLFSDITTPAEQKRGFIAADVLLKRCLEEESYLKGARRYPGATGTGLAAATVYFQGQVYTLMVYEYFNSEATEEATGFYWEVANFEFDGFEDTVDGMMLDRFVPLTLPALVSSIASTFGLCPEKLAREAVDYHAYCQGELNFDFSKPNDDLLPKYKLMP